MTRALAMPVASAGVLFALAIAAGPMIGVGALFGAVCVAAIYRWPILGLAAMVLSGTALQVLGSEHLTGLPMSLGKLAGILTLAALSLRLAVSGAPLTYTAQWPALAAFAAILALSTFTASDPALARDGLFRYAQLFLLIVAIATIAGERRRALDQACLIVSACMAACSIIGLLEFFLPSLSLESDDPSLIQGAVGAILDHDSIAGVDVKRITGGLSDSNWFAYTVASFLPLNLYLLHRFRTPATRAALLGASVLQAIGIVLSLTRSAVIAAGVGGAVLLWRRRLPVAPVLGALAVGAAGFVLWNPPGLQRLFSPEFARAGSTPMREELLRGGLTMVEERPLLGYGYSEFGPIFMKWLPSQNPGEAIAQWADDVQRQVDAGEEALENVMPHNTAIQLTVEFGLLGFGAFCLFLTGLVRDIGVIRRFGTAADALLADCLLAGFCTFVTCAAFGHLALLKVVWMLGGLTAAARRVALETAPA